MGETVFGGISECRLDVVGGCSGGGCHGEPFAEEGRVVAESEAFTEEPFAARAVMRCALAAICSSVSVSLTTLKRWLPAVQILPSLCIRARERATAGTGRLLPYFGTKISEGAENSVVLRRMMASTSRP